MTIFRVSQEDQAKKRTFSPCPSQNSEGGNGETRNEIEMHRGSNSRLKETREEWKLEETSSSDPLTPVHSWGIASGVVGAVGWANASHLWRVAGKQVWLSALHRPAAVPLSLAPWRQLWAVTAAPPLHLALAAQFDDDDSHVTLTLCTLPEGVRAHSVTVALHSVCALQWQGGRLWTLGKPSQLGPNAQPTETHAVVYGWQPSNGTADPPLWLEGEAVALAVSDSGAVAVAGPLQLTVVPRGTEGPRHRLRGAWTATEWLGESLAAVTAQGSLAVISLAGEWLQTFPVSADPPLLVRGTSEWCLTATAGRLSRWRRSGTSLVADGSWSLGDTSPLRLVAVALQGATVTLRGVTLTLQGATVALVSQAHQVVVATLEDRADKDRTSDLAVPLSSIVTHQAHVGPIVGKDGKVLMQAWTFAPKRHSSSRVAMTKQFDFGTTTRRRAS